MGDLAAFFAPQSLAVIGASARPGKIGFAILRNVLASGYRGAVYPVNPGADEIQGLKCYPGVGAIPGPVEMAVVAVPAARVVEVARECGEKGVRSLVVISAGFREIGSEGRRREKELMAVCREYGLRMLGPNCVGLMDTHTPLNASFAAGFPRPGEIAFISQSGAMLVAILDWSFGAGLGFSKFVSLGNKADLNEADFIAAAGADPATRVILCYIEDVADGRQFLDVAARVTGEKPVIVLKSGTSRAGARAASSHTGALAGNDAAYEAAFRACGVIRARTMDELFHLAAAFARQPVPRGANVAVVTNAGGPGIVATDEIERVGLRMGRFGRETVAGLREDLPREAGIYNPVDVLGDATPERYCRALERVLRDDGVDGVLLLLCPTAPAQPVETARAIIDLYRRYPAKPLLAVYIGGSHPGRRRPPPEGSRNSLFHLSRGRGRRSGGYGKIYAAWPPGARQDPSLLRGRGPRRGAGGVGRGTGGAPPGAPGPRGLPGGGGLRHPGGAGRAGHFGASRGGPGRGDRLSGGPEGGLAEDPAQERRGRCASQPHRRAWGAGVLLVTGVENDYSLDALIFYNRYLAARGVTVVGNLFNGVPRPLLAKTEGVYRRVLEGRGYRVLGVVPRHPEIGAPTVAEYYEVLGGELLAGEGHLDRPVEDVLVGAMTIESALGYLRRAANKAVVTGGDRAEIALAALETSTSVLILTGGLYPDVRVIARADERGVPVILVHYDTYTTVEKLATVTRHLHPEDRRGIAIARENIERHCDLTALLEVLQP